MANAWIDFDVDAENGDLKWIEICNSTGMAIRLSKSDLDWAIPALHEFKRQMLAREVANGKISINTARLAMGITKPAEENEVNCNAPVSLVIERIPTFEAARPDHDNLDYIANWMGATSYTVKSLENDFHEVTFAVKGTDGKTRRLKTRIHTRLHEDILVKEADGTFSVMSEEAFNERFELPKLDQLDVMPNALR